MKLVAVPNDGLVLIGRRGRLLGLLRGQHPTPRGESLETEGDCSAVRRIISLVVCESNIAFEEHNGALLLTPEFAAHAQPEVVFVTQSLAVVGLS